MNACDTAAGRPLAALLIAAVLAAVLAAVPTARAEGAPGADRSAARQALLERLAGAATETEGRAAEDAVWRFWMEAPDARAQALLDRALERRRWYDFAGALEHLDRLVETYPDYAEGWNQRATIHFLREEYAQALADIEETLAREPAHFGALAGKAIILMRQDRTAEGQLALVEALKIHPWLKERHLLTPGRDL